MSPDLLNTEQERYAIKTWRYLRLTMVALVIGLGVSVAFERVKVPANCWQKSLSAYYYTPAHGYFVAALLGIGVCLFCLRGCTDIEDGLLNLAGLLAPVVALVPTPNPGTCASVLGSLDDPSVNIANNITALIVVGGLAGVILAGLTLLGKRFHPPRTAQLMFVVAASVWIALILVFKFERHFFQRNAHYGAAIPMFACILAVVLFNALGYMRKKAREHKEARPLRNPYVLIGGAMIASSAIIGIAAVLGWEYWVIAIECALISLFGVFWVIQTIELWDDGLRSVDSPSTAAADCVKAGTN